MIFDDLLFKRDQGMERKNYSIAQFIGCNGDLFNKNSNPGRFLQYYLENSPLATCIKLLSNNATSIPFVVKDRKTGKFIDHEVLKLLRNPNPFSSGQLFETELLNFFLLTGNCFLNIIGSSNPLELYNLRVDQIQIDSDDLGYPASYNFQNNRSRLRFKRDKGYRFFANESSEIVHLRNFNPNYGSNSFFGISEFEACEIEIALFNIANTHNHYLLKNQARPSGIITYNGDMSALNSNQADRVEKQIKEQLSGVTNSGRMAFLGGNFSWQQLSESIKDMDFATLYRRTSEAIYNVMKIPLPLVSPDNMTLANMETAKMNLLDNAVIPLKITECNFLTKVLMRRYKNSENLEITFDEAEIEVLKPREVQNAVKIAKSGVLTVNEVRASLGFDPLPGDNGNELTGIEKTKEKEGDIKKISEKHEEKTFLASLRKENGDRLYSDDLINMIIE